MAQQITLQQLQSAKRSVQGRRARLRRYYRPWRQGGGRHPSPIAKIEAFGRDIDDMERILDSMAERLDNAKITIEI